MKVKSISQLESALPLCWDNPFVFVSSEHHHSTSQTWSQQHSIYWLYLIFLIFNYQTPHKVYDVCTEFWQIPGHTFHHHSPGRHYCSLSAPPASLSTVCTVSRKSQVTPRHSHHHLVFFLCVGRENAVCGWTLVWRNIPNRTECRNSEVWLDGRRKLLTFYYYIIPLCPH